MSTERNLYFTSKHVEAIFGIDRKVLLYWRKIGILNPQLTTPGGHFRYSFTDLAAVKTILMLNESGISTYKIKKMVEELKKQFPDITSPLTEKSFCVVGKEVLIVNRKGDYNPFTKQYSFIRFEETKSLVRSLTLDKFNIPQNVKRNKNLGENSS